ncbi:MAG: nucleotidyltransferase family protein [Caldisericaceae bacterium]
MITGVLLAAGKSERMGEPKILLKIGNKTVIEILLNEYLSSKLQEVVLVLGKNAEMVKTFVNKTFNSDKLTIAVNDNYEMGMFSSIQKGVAVANCKDTLIGLSDNVLVNTAIINTLIEHYSEGEILIPTTNGRKGHPVIIPQATAQRILKADPAKTTLKDILFSDRDLVKLLPVEDESILIDMDTKEDYKRVLSLYNLSSGEH